MKKYFIALIVLSFTKLLYAQVGIGTITPNVTSQLEINANDKGVLIPRVSLNDITETTLDGTNTAQESLLIYNTNALVTGGNGKGFYYFNGTVWENLQSKNNASVFKSAIVEPDADFINGIIYNANGLPTNIALNGVHYTINIPVAGFSGTINEISLTLDLTHTWDEDLEIFLTSPTGNILELTTDNGGFNDNYQVTIFTDTAATKLQQVQLLLMIHIDQKEHLMCQVAV